MTTMDNAAIYVRVSSEMQLDGHSLDAQERLCREFCQRHNLTAARIYREEAESASSTERPELQRMLADVRAGLYSTIVFYHTWRFSRNIEDSALMTRLERSGVRLMSVTDAIDSATPAGRLQRNITLAIGQHYLDQLRAETTRGKRERALHGLSNASRPPFGYSRIHDAGKVTDAPNADATIAREIFVRYATGRYTDLQIADWLNAQGKRTSGNWGSRPFSKDTVRAILLNRFYAGEVGYRGLSERETGTGKRARASKRTWKWVAGVHVGIVEKDLFERCEHARTERGKRFSGRRASSARVYLFSRLGRCAHCGRPLRAMRFGASDTSSGYRCTARETGLECAAAHPTLPETALLADLDQIVAQVSIPESLRAQVVAVLGSGIETSDADRHRAELTNELHRWNHIYKAGNVGDAEYDRETARIKAELAAIKKPSKQVDVGAAIRALSSMASVWAKATADERQEILRELFDAFRIDTDTRRIVAFKPKKEHAALLRAAFSKNGSDGI